MQRCLAVLKRDIGVGTGCQQHSEEFRPHFRKMKRHGAVLILDVGIGTGLQQRPNCNQIPPDHCPVQWYGTILVLDVGISTSSQQRSDWINDPLGHG